MRKDALENKKRIISVVRRLYDHQDITQLSMREIAKEAGVGIGTLYRTFPNRDELYIQFVEEKMKKFVDEERHDLAQSEICEHTFDRLLNNYIIFREENQKILNKIEQPSQQINQFYNSNLYEELVEILNDILEKLIPELTSQEITFRSDMIIAMLNSNIFYFQRSRRKLSTQNIFDNIKKLIFHKQKFR